MVTVVLADGFDGGDVELTVDGLGPRGGHAHHPDEFVAVDSVRPRAEIALAVAIAALGAA